MKLPNEVLEKQMEFALSHSRLKLWRRGSFDEEIRLHRSKQNKLRHNIGYLRRKLQEKRVDAIGTGLWLRFRDPHSPRVVADAQAQPV